MATSALSLAPEYDIREVNTRAKPPERRKKTANDFMRQANKTLADEISEFSEWLIDYMEILRTGAEQLREREEFSKRFERNIDRDRCYVAPQSNGRGGINRLAKDGHAVMGIQQGWSHQARQVASDTMHSRIFGSDIWWRLRPRGKTKEGPIMAKVFTDLVAHCLKMANFGNTAAIKSTEETPRHGTSVMRYRMGRRVMVSRDENGMLVEEVTDLVPWISVWPINQVYPCRLDTNEQQPGYFFVTPSTTLSALEREEAMFEFYDAGENSVVRVAGRFRNLYPLRQDLRKLSRDMYADKTKHEVRTSDREDVLHVSHQHQFSLVEYEGTLPLAAAVAEKKLTPRIASFFGINVGFLPKEGDEDELEDWGYALERVPVYRMSYVLDPDNHSTTVCSQILELSPPTSRVDYPEVVETRFGLDGHKWLGMSVTDYGWRLEDFGDLMRNHQAKIMAQNVDPSYAVDYRLLQNKKQGEVKRLIRGGGELISVLGGADVTKVAQPFLVEQDPNKIENIIQTLKFEFEAATGVTKIAKGNSSAPTATANALEAGASDLRLGQVARRNVQQYLKLVRWIIRDLTTMMTREELIRFAARVSGTHAAALSKYLPSLDGVEDQFDYLPRSPIVADAVQTATVMNRTVQLMPDVIANSKRQYFELVMDLMGLPGAEQLALSGPEMFEPNEEHLMMSQGTWVDVNPNDNDQQHLLEHGAELDRINAGIPIEGMSEEETKVLGEQLAIHVKQQFAQMQMKMQMAQLQAMAMGGGQGGQNGTQGGGGGLMNTSGEPTRLEQDTNPATSEQLGQNIRERAGG